MRVCVGKLEIHLVLNRLQKVLHALRRKTCHGLNEFRFLSLEKINYMLTLSSSLCLSPLLVISVSLFLNAFHYFLKGFNGNLLYFLRRFVFENFKLSTSKYLASHNLGRS